MIKAKIKEVAAARGVPNAYQLGVLIGVTPNVSARLWKDDFAQIGRITLDKLCSALNCTVGDLLVYEGATSKPIKRGKSGKQGRKD